jgi:hypothetical protein
VTKEQLEIINELRARAWQSFDERRRHDYKIGLLFWGIFITAVGGFLNLKDPLSAEIKMGFSVGLILLAELYVRWNLGVAKLNRLDRRMAVFWADKLMQDCGVYEEFWERFPESDPSMITATMKDMTFRDYLGNWNHRSCVCVTGVLTLSAIAVLWRASGPMCIGIVILLFLGAAGEAWFEVRSAKKRQSNQSRAQIPALLSESGSLRDTSKR